jgi:hypothetical protein
LRPAQIAIDVAEQGGGRAETVPVGDSRPLAPFPQLLQALYRAGRTGELGLLERAGRLILYLVTIN